MPGSLGVRTVSAPDYAPEEIAEIARSLRAAAGLREEPTGVVANGGRKTKRKANSTVTRGRAHGR